MVIWPAVVWPRQKGFLREFLPYVQYQNELVCLFIRCDFTFAGSDASGWFWVEVVYSICLSYAFIMLMAQRWTTAEQNGALGFYTERLTGHCLVNLFLRSWSLLWWLVAWKRKWCQFYNPYNKVFADWRGEQRSLQIVEIKTPNVGTNG